MNSIGYIAYVIVHQRSKEDVLKEFYDIYDTVLKPWIDANNLWPKLLSCCSLCIELDCRTSDVMLKIIHFSIKTRSYVLLFPPNSSPYGEPLKADFHSMKSERADEKLTLSGN